ncbi:MAG: radical SAM protein [bacterium]
MGVYGGIATGYLVGCCLRCSFCWVDWSRDFPERHGQFYTPQQVFNRLINIAGRKRVDKLRVSGGEPTLSQEHLLALLDLIDATHYLFILETNGILLGQDKSYVQALAKYQNLYIRLSIKAGNAEGFERRTGALGEFHELPYKAVEYLLKCGTYFRVASMSDPRLMPPAERAEMIAKLKAIGYDDYLEEEDCDPYPTSVARLQYAGFKVF